MDILAVISIFLISSLQTHFQANLDAADINSGSYPSHKENVAETLGVLAIISIAALVFLDTNLMVIVAAWLLTLSVKWFYTDFRINILTGKPAWYIGLPEEGKDDATLDNFLLWFPKPHFTQYIIKAIPLGISIYLLIHYHIIKL